ncbi:hypothetical protein L596_027024 [Steinernema carpocapsae]|uniref:DUF8206 domain-containing protein n=1 Tax=Steinernema carpocapsae TaxID=34508 RepID=A0A4U5M334_STECR|nr:hypothetical protein L596_027024 [Steinernema carpocapsae]
MEGPSIFIRIPRTEVQVSVPLVVGMSLQQCLESVYVQNFGSPMEEVGVVVRKYFQKFQQYVNMSENPRTFYPVDGDKFEAILRTSDLATNENGFQSSVRTNQVFYLFGAENHDQDFEENGHVENTATIVVVTENETFTKSFPIEQIPAPSVEDLIKDIMYEHGMNVGKFFVQAEIAGAIEEYVDLEDDYSNVELREGANYRLTFLQEENMPDLVPAYATIMSLEPDSTVYNILLVGETGSGKSTLINAIFNYIRFPSVHSADGHTPIVAIPSQFDVADKNDVYKTVKIGQEDPNESYANIGESVTRTPHCYEFSYQGKTYRIIDSPGLGDTRGVPQDKKNMDMILRQLFSLHEIHAICVVMKTKDKLSTGLKFCLNHIRTQVHPEAVKKLFFCFTYANDNHFGQADGVVLLDRFFKDEGFACRVNPESTFYFDNSGFRYMAIQADPNIDLDLNAEDYEDSWKASRSFTRRLLREIARRPAHNLRQSKCLSEMRHCVEELIHISAEVIKAIGENKFQLEQRLNSLATKKGKKLPLPKLKDETFLSVSFEPLDKPMIVCANPKCAKKESPGEWIRCEHNCQIRGITMNQCGQEELKYSPVFDLISQKCLQCGCSWSVHMLSNVVKKTVQLPMTTKFSNSNVSTSLKDLKKFYEGQRKKLEGDEDRIKQICAQLSTFLIQNSIVTHNDFYLEYLKQKIADAKYEFELNGKESSKAAVDHLEEHVRTYEEEVKLLSQTSEGTRFDINEDFENCFIYQLEKELYEIDKDRYRFQELMKAADGC